MACPHNWVYSYKGPKRIVVCTLCDLVASGEEYAAIVAKSIDGMQVVGMDIDEPKVETWRDRPALL